MSIFLAPRMSRYKSAMTAGDIIAIHYGTKAKILTGFLSLVVCAGILGAQVSAIGYIFNVFLGIKRTYGILIGCSVVLLYSTSGGLKAVVATDVLQFVILALGIPMALVFGLEYAGGISEVVAIDNSSEFTNIKLCVLIKMAVYYKILPKKNFALATNLRLLRNYLMHDMLTTFTETKYSFEYNLSKEFNNKEITNVLAISKEEVVKHCLTFSQSEILAYYILTRTRTLISHLFNSRVKRLPPSC